MTPAGDGASPRAAARGATAIALVVLAVSPAVVLLPAIGPGRTVLGIDFVNVFYFTRRFVIEELRAGRLAVWDPYTLCGFPLLAALQAAVFYPPSWLELALPAAAFWTFAAWLHVTLAGIFAQAWLRRGLGVDALAALAGALAFSLSGYLFARLHAGHVNYVWAYPWGAAALWRLERWLAGPSLRRAVLLALPLPLMVVAGVPQLAYATALVVAARIGGFLLRGAPLPRVRQRMVAGALATLGTGMLLAAPQLLPTIELIGQTQRAGLAGEASFAESFALPPENLLTLVAPALYGDGVTERYWGRWYAWETCGYVGAVGLVLALLGCGARRPQRGLWLGVAGLSLLVALGPHAPVFGWFRSLIPGAALFRGPARYLYAFVLASAVLVAFGVERLRGDDATAQAAARRVAVGALLAAAAMTLTALFLHHTGSDAGPWRAILEHARLARADWTAASGIAPLPVADADFRATAHHGTVSALGTAVVWSALAGLALLGFATGALAARGARIAVVVLLALDLMAFDRRQILAVELAQLAWPDSTTALLRSRVGDDLRLTNASRGDVADAGRARLAGLAHAGGYEPMLLRRYAELVNVANGLPADRMMVLATPSRPHPVAALMGARVWLAPPGTLATTDLRPLAGAAGGSTLLEWRAALPRVRLVARSVIEPDAARRLALLGAPGWNPRTTVILEDPALTAEDLGPSVAATHVAIANRAPGRYDVDVDAPDGGFLVLAESWFPGWSATVDGRPVDLLRADHLFQAVRLRPGTHRVTFAYRSRFLYAGALVAAAALLAPCVALGVRRLRRRRFDAR